MLPVLDEPACDSNSQKGWCKSNSDDVASQGCDSVTSGSLSGSPQIAQSLPDESCTPSTKERRKSWADLAEEDLLKLDDPDDEDNSDLASTDCNSSHAASHSAPVSLMLSEIASLSDGDFTAMSTHGISTPDTSPRMMQETWYRVAYVGGLDLRREPNYAAIRTGVTLSQNETFKVSDELPGMDGRVYLRLSDGRGWAFDDSALMPHDPSVRKGGWILQSPLGAQIPQSLAVPPAYSPPAMWPMMAAQGSWPPTPTSPYAGSPVHAAPPAQIMYRVACMGGLDLRREPEYAAIRTGVTLHHNEIFAVSEEVAGTDGRTYLRLADGRGWAFDDSLLKPYDPTVKKGGWLPCVRPTGYAQIPVLPPARTNWPMATDLVTQPPGAWLVPSTPAPAAPAPAPAPGPAPAPAPAPAAPAPGLAAPPAPPAPPAAPVH